LAVHVESRKRLVSIRLNWSARQMNNLLWSTFQHKNGPIDPSSQTRVWISRGQQGFWLSNQPNSLLTVEWNIENWLHELHWSLMDTSNQDVLLMIF